MNKALSDLEEISIRFKWCEIQIEHEIAVCFYFNLRGLYFERILAFFACFLIDYWQKSPVNSDREGKLVLQGKLVIFAQCSVLCKPEVNVLGRQLKILKFWFIALNHFFMQHCLIRLVHRQITLWPLLIFIFGAQKHWIILDFIGVVSLLFLFHDKLFMCSHNYLGTKRFNVPLLNWHGLCKYVEACPQQVNE